MDGRLQAGEAMSPKSQDADIENIGVTNHSHSPELEGFSSLSVAFKEVAALRFLRYPLAGQWSHAFFAPSL
jgi:hypothetical protein